MSARASLAIVAFGLAACGPAAMIDRETRELEAALNQTHEAAVACAPTELARAEAHIEFGRYESLMGRPLVADNHLAEARRLVSLVLEKAKGTACEGDRDGDGIPDSIDRCPDIPEDFDNEDDTDGCPDYDRDKDGIPDDRDKCPNDAEDKDKFEDNDGCPEFDNDKDGIMDSVDQCVNQPEDFDGYQDLDGCPDYDNDGDDIPDLQDKCPNSPGPASNGGCSDAYKYIVVRDDVIELRQTIFFAHNTATIEGRSFAVLDEVAAALKAKKTVRVRIEGHTDSEGPGDKNLKLSQQRASAVKTYLAGKGVTASRMDTQGLGEDQPIDENDTEEGRATNRRVEFHILK